MPEAEPPRTVGASRPRAECSSLRSLVLLARATRIRLVPLSALAIIAGLLAGCGGSGTHPQSLPSGSSSPRATVSDAPSGLTDKQLAQAAALKQVQRYEHTLSALAIDPRMSLNRLDSVSTEPDLAAEVRSINELRSSGARQVGYSRIAGSRIDAVSLPTSDSGAATVRVTICLDVRDVHGYGRSGRSIVPKSRKPFFLTHIVVVNRNYPDRSPWLVSKVTDHEQSKCAV